MSNTVLAVCPIDINWVGFSVISPIFLVCVPRDVICGSKRQKLRESNRLSRIGAGPGLSSERVSSRLCRRQGSLSVVGILVPAAHWPGRPDPQASMFIEFAGKKHASERTHCTVGAHWLYPCGSAPVAQLDRAPDYESGGLGFESLRVRHFFRYLVGHSVTRFREPELPASQLRQSPAGL